MRLTPRGPNSFLATPPGGAPEPRSLARRRRPLRRMRCRVVARGLERAGVRRGHGVDDRDGVVGLAGPRGDERERRPGAGRLCVGVCGPPEPPRGRVGVAAVRGRVVRRRGRRPREDGQLLLERRGPARRFGDVVVDVDVEERLEPRQGRRRVLLRVGRRERLAAPRPTREDQAAASPSTPPSRPRHRDDASMASGRTCSTTPLGRLCRLDLAPAQKSLPGRTHVVESRRRTRTRSILFRL